MWISWPFWSHIAPAWTVALLAPTLNIGRGIEKPDELQNISERIKLLETGLYEVRQAVKKNLGDAQSPEPPKKLQKRETQGSPIYLSRPLLEPT